MNDPHQAPRRFFFVHIMKTGGISLLWRLRRAFPESAIFPNDSDGDTRSDGPQISVPRLTERWADPARRAQIRLIAGHFPLCTVDLLDAPFERLTVLREPVERTLSFLSHHRQHRPEAAEVPLEVLYEDRFLTDHLIRNHMTKMFSLTAAEMTHGMMTPARMDAGHLAKAKEGLARMDAVGFTDLMEPFCDAISRRYGWDLGEPIRSNTSLPVSASRSFRRRIAADNALDVELYEFARDRLPAIA